MKRPPDAFFTPVACLTALLGVGCVGSVGNEPGSSGPNDPGNPSNPSNPGNGNTGNGNTGNGNTGNGNMGNGNTPSTPGTVNAAGRTPMRRLTHAQFNNTVHDLLGIEGDFTDGFAIDEEASGFRANVTSPVSDSQVDKYDQTAELIAGKAIAAGLDKLAPCLPPKAEADCAADFVRNFGKRAFRRPLDPEQVTRYRAVWDAGKKADGTFAGGIGLVISAMLQSPHFLYLPEVGSAGGNGPVALDSYEVASRLSYFLQDSMPDADLFAAADGDKLKNPDEIATQTKRLLGTPRGRTVTTGFFRQWLETESVTSLDKDEKAFPAFNPELRAAMAAELDAYVGHVMGGSGAGADGKLTTLLTGNFVFPQGPLATVYGVPAATARTDAPAGQRAGLLTLAGVMALYAHPDQSAPVSRGYLVSEKLLCVVPPPAPDNVEIMLPKPDPNKTTRERFLAHRENPTCASCHALMDPYGLTFENYDAIGRYRERDGNNLVDATSKLPGYGDIKNAVDLMAKMSGSKEVANCMTRQWYRFALGRTESDLDMASIASAEDAFRRADLRIPDLIVALTGTPAFRQRPAIR